VAIGLFAAPLFAYSERAAAQLLAVSPYVDAVIGAGGVDISDLPPEVVLQPAALDPGTTAAVASAGVEATVTVEAGS